VLGERLIVLDWLGLGEAKESSIDALLHNHHLGLALLRFHNLVFLLFGSLLKEHGSVCFDFQIDALDLLTSTVFELVPLASHLLVCVADIALPEAERFLTLSIGEVAQAREEFVSVHELHNPVKVLVRLALHRNQVLLLLSAPLELGEDQFHTGEVFFVQAEEKTLVVDLLAIEEVGLFFERQLGAEGVDKFLVLSAKERPFEELAAADMALGVVVALELGHVLEDLEYFASHAFGLGHSELEEEHTNVSFKCL